MRRVAAVGVVVVVAAVWAAAGASSPTRPIHAPHLLAGTHAFHITATSIQQLDRSLLHALSVRRRQSVPPVPRPLASHYGTCFVAAGGGCSLTPCVYSTRAAAALTLPATPAAKCRRPGPIQIGESVVTAVPAGQPSAARATK